LVIAFPAMVMHYKATGPQVDPSNVRIDIPPPPSFQGLPGLPGAPDLNIPSLSPIGQPPPPIPTPQPPSVPNAAGPVTPTPSTVGPATSAPNAEAPAALAPSTSAPVTPPPVPSPPSVDIGTPRELQPREPPDVSKEK